MPRNHDHAWICAGRSEVDRHDGVVRMWPAPVRMVLTHANPALAPGIDQSVGVAPPANGCDRGRLCGEVADLIQPSVGPVGAGLIVGKVNAALGQAPSATAVFMHTAAGAERRWNDV